MEDGEGPAEWEIGIAESRKREWENGVPRRVGEKAVSSRRSPRKTERKLEDGGWRDQGTACGVGVTSESESADGDAGP